jgi:hypothetical protein
MSAATSPSSKILSRARQQEGPRVVKMTITPQDAEELLKRNTINRKLNKNTVRDLVRDIKASRWKLTHQGIALTPSYDVLDGQHRLHAIIEAAQQVDMFVTFDVDPDSFLYIDRMRRKSTALLLNTDTITAAVARAGCVLEVGDAAARPSAVEQEEMMHLLHGLMSTIDHSIRRPPLLGKSAMVRMGAIINMLSGHQEYALAGIKAISARDYPAMTHGVASLARWLENGDKRSGGRDGMAERLVRAHKGFDPARRDDSRIIIRSVSDDWKDLADLFREQIGKLRAEVAAKAGE